MTYSVCVIIPCYNDSETLNRALISVFNQTRLADEIIVVNDCSPKSRAIEKIVSLYPQVFYIKNDKNLGPSSSRNIGVKHSNSDLISFLDADDEVHPQKIEVQLRVYRPNYAVTCAFARKNNFASGKTNQSLKIKYYENKKKLLVRNTLNGAGMLVSKKLLLMVGGYDKNLRSCEDWDLWLRLIDNGVKIIKIKFPLYLYHNNPNSLSNNYCNISYYETKCIEKHTADVNYSSLFRQFLWFSVILKQIYRSTILMKNIDTKSDYKIKNKKLDNLISDNIGVKISPKFLKLILSALFTIRGFESSRYLLRFMKIIFTKIFK